MDSNANVLAVFSERDVSDMLADEHAGSAGRYSSLLSPKAVLLEGQPGFEKMKLSSEEDV